jgi:hypothetical protein
MAYGANIRLPKRIFDPPRSLFGEKLARRMEHRQRDGKETTLGFQGAKLLAKS